MSAYLRKIGKELLYDSDCEKRQVGLTPITYDKNGKKAALSQRKHDSLHMKTAEQLKRAASILNAKEYLVLDWLTHTIQRFKNFDDARLEFLTQAASSGDEDTDVELLVSVDVCNNVSGKQKRRRRKS